MGHRNTGADSNRTGSTEESAEKKSDVGALKSVEATCKVPYISVRLAVSVVGVGLVVVHSRVDSYWRWYNGVAMLSFFCERA